MALSLREDYNELAWTPFSYISAGSANQDSQNVKATGGVVGSISVFSTVTTLRFVKLYNKATAPTSADTPVYRVSIPGNTTGAGSNLPLPQADAFPLGIGFRITTGAADSDTGTVAANDVFVNLGYN